MIMYREFVDESKLGRPTQLSMFCYGRLTLLKRRRDVVFVDLTIVSNQI